jgi:hypothetical protein
MRKVILYLGIICFLSGCRKTVEAESYVSDSKEFQLSSPLITSEKTLFKDSTFVVLESPYPGAILWFQSAGMETNYHTAPTPYKSAIGIGKNTILRAYATHPEYKTSDTISLEVYKIKHSLNQSQISISPRANHSYLGKGATTLINSTKGSLSFRNSDEWLGFDQAKVTIDIVFDPPITIDKVLISSLIDQDAWIFPLAHIKVKEQSKEVGIFINKDANSSIATQLKTFVVSIPNKNYSQLTIELASVKNIPDWHPGKGTQAWFFIDQILVE